MDDTAESMSAFQEKIAVAQANGDEWVETTPLIIKTLQPRGLNGSKYFIYHGVKVCENGQSDQIAKECDEPLNNRIHGATEAKVISGR